MRGLLRAQRLAPQSLARQFRARDGVRRRRLPTSLSRSRAHGAARTPSRNVPGCDLMFGAHPRRRAMCTHSSSPSRKSCAGDVAGNLMHSTGTLGLDSRSSERGRQIYFASASGADCSEQAREPCSEEPCIAISRDMARPPFCPVLPYKIPFWATRFCPFWATRFWTCQSQTHSALRPSGCE
jgi:hypothetical protein